MEKIYIYLSNFSKIVFKIHHNYSNNYNTICHEMGIIKHLKLLYYICRKPDYNVYKNIENGYRNGLDLIKIILL